MRGALALLLSAAIGSVEAGTAALLIDDLGNNRGLARRALALPPPVAVAVLPGSPYARDVARAAHRAGSDVVVHLPMEASGVTPAAGTLRSDMAPAEFRAHVDAALAAVPRAIGVNNHMGSGLTRERLSMDRLMHQLAARGGLLFIDSRTTADSHAAAAARSAGLAVAHRDVFLDHDRDPAAIAGQVRRWLERARNHGCALAIAHPHPETLEVLERMLPRADDVRRVGLRTYVERCGTPAMRPGGAGLRAEGPGSARR